MARAIKQGQHIFIAFQDGEAVLDSQLRPRMYKSREQFEKSFPAWRDGKAELVEYAPTLSQPSNEPLTLEQLREMGGQPYWHVGLRKESPPPHWNILDPFYAKHIEDYKYGENWLAYLCPPEGEEDT